MDSRFYGQYKIYLQNNDSTIKEIRKFKVSNRDVFDFVQFCEKVKQLFPELRDGKFVVSWKDEEGDEIIISTSEEFEVAVESMRNDINRIYVKIPSGNQETSTSNVEKVIHPGICCDNCNGNVVGYRYKCIQCEDYDLCSRCEAKGLHSHHYMIRMPQPLQWYHSQGLIYCLRKFLKKSEIHSNKKHGSNEHSRRKKKCQEFPLNYNVLPWLEVFMPYLNNFIEKKGEPSSSADAGPSKETSEQKGEKSSKAYVRVYQTDSDDLDVVIEVDSDKPETSSVCNTEKEQNFKDVPANKDDSNKFPGEGRKLRDDTKDDKASVSDTASVTSQDSIAKIGIQEDWTILDKNESADISRASSVLSNLNESTDKQTPSAPSLSERNSSGKNIYPQLSEDTRIYHSNPMIQAAVESMTKMGFSNQGGLLTYLLEAENGNINKVLDLLQHTDK